MNAATFDGATDVSAQGRTLVKLLREYQKRLADVRDRALAVRKYREPDSLPRLEQWVLRERETDVRHMWETLNVAARKLIRIASQWLEHSSVPGSADEIEVSVRLAEFEGLFLETENAVERAFRPAPS